MTERAPDPFRPGEIPEGRPFGRLGRPGFAAAVLLVIVAAALLVLLLAVR